MKSRSDWLAQARVVIILITDINALTGGEEETKQIGKRADAFRVEGAVFITARQLPHTNAQETWHESRVDYSRPEPFTVPVTPSPPSSGLF